MIPTDRKNFVELKAFPENEFSTKTQRHQIASSFNQFVSWRSPNVSLLTRFICNNCACLASKCFLVERWRKLISFFIDISLFFLIFFSLSCLLSQSKLRREGKLFRNLYSLEFVEHHKGNCEILWDNDDVFNAVFMFIEFFFSQRLMQSTAWKLWLKRQFKDAWKFLAFLADCKN